MTVLVCSDLDRTLIYSQAAFALDGPDEAMPRLVCVEFYQGAPLSYMTEAAARTLETLAASAVFVPTTTRTPEQYRRVHLLEKQPAYAICANGGHLLVDGEDDPSWSASVRARIADGCAPLAEINDRLVRTGGGAEQGPPQCHSGRNRGPLEGSLEGPVVAGADRCRADTRRGRGRSARTVHHTPLSRRDGPFRS